jgi:hypothetical protein
MPQLMCSKNVLAIRIHSDDSNDWNGPLRVVLATRRSGVLSDDSIHELANKITPAECHVGAGAGFDETFANSLILKGRRR